MWAIRPASGKLRHRAAGSFGNRATGARSECLLTSGRYRWGPRIEPLEAELRPFAKTDPRAVLLDTIPGVAELLALTIAVEIGEISRFASPEKCRGRTQSPDRRLAHALPQP